MGEEKITLTLLEHLALRIGCTYLSDLTRIGEVERYYLAREVKSLGAECFSLREWNDALSYLVIAPPVRSAGEEQGRLAELLLKSKGYGRSSATQ